MSAYVAIHDCGKIVAAAVDAPECAKMTAREVARWIRDGYTVERKPVEEVRLADWCKCHWRKTNA